jgi:predicted ATPase
VGVLDRELGVEPEARTQVLYKRLIVGMPAAPVRGRQPAPIVGWSPGEAELPLIAREREWAAAQGALDAAVAGRGRTLVVMGEAGVGKSRLLQEIAREAVRGGCLVLLGHASPAQRALPFEPWIDAFRTSRVLEDGDLRARLDAGCRRELARLFPALESAPAETPADAHVRLFAAMAHLIQSLAVPAPLVLVLEDFQWADDASVRLLSFVARPERGLRVLVVASARVEDIADAPLLRDLMREDTIAELVIEPLSQAGTHALVHTLSRPGAAPEAQARLAGQVWRASAGNPFVIVESLRALRHGAGTVQAGEVPLSAPVRDLVRARLERLSATARAVTALAAVVPNEFEFPLLLRASDRDEGDVVEALEELVGRRVLRVTGERFDFVHDRVREVAYADLLPPRRRLLHRSVAEALEALHRDRLDEHSAAIGHHYQAAEAWSAALAFLERAGAHAFEQSALRDAAACFRQALSVLDHLPPSREAMEKGIDLRFQLTTANVTLTEFNGERARLHREAERLAVDLGDDRRLA